MRKNITEGSIDFRRAYLRAIIKEIQIHENHIAIIGSKEDMERAYLMDGKDPGVPTFIPGWRRGSPPYLLPMSSENIHYVYLS